MLIQTLKKKCHGCKLFLVFNGVYCLDCFCQLIDFRPDLKVINRCIWYEGCNEEGEKWYYDHDVSELFCYEHAGEMGFCLWCGNFYGGVESFEFNNPGKICDNCRCWTCGQPDDFCQCSGSEYDYEDMSDYP